MQDRNDHRTSATIITLVLIGVAAWFLYGVRAILLPFILSAIFAYLLSPVVNRLQARFRLKRVYAVIALYLLFMLALFLAVVSFAPPISREIHTLEANLPGYIERGKAWFLGLQNTLETRYPFLREQNIVSRALAGTGKLFAAGLAGIPGYLFGIFSVIVLIVLIPVITFFFLLGGKRAVNALVNVISSRYTETSLSILWEIDEVLVRYLIGMVTEAAAVGMLSTIGFLIIGLNYAFLIGIVVAFANIVPFLGPVVGGIVAMIVGLAQYQNVSIVLKVLIIVVAVRLLDDNVIQPAIQSTGLKLNPALIIFAILAGAELYGVLGMLLSVPTAAVLKVILDVLLKKRYA